MGSYTNDILRGFVVLVMEGVTFKRERERGRVMGRSEGRVRGG